MPTVLIVDDHPIVRTAIRSRFEKFCGLSVCGEAIDGVDAIQKALQLKPDLILLDLAMPRMNGVVAATILKSLLPQVRIIAFTLHSAALGKHLASTAGFDAVLSKFDGIHSVKDCVQSVMAPQ